MTLYVGASHETAYNGYLIVEYESFVRIYGWYEDCYCLLIEDDLPTVSDAMSHIDNYL